MYYLDTAIFQSDYAIGILPGKAKECEIPRSQEPPPEARLPIAHDVLLLTSAGRVKGGAAGEYSERTLDATEHGRTMFRRWAYSGNDRISPLNYCGIQQVE